MKAGKASYAYKWEPRVSNKRENTGESNVVRDRGLPIIIMFYHDIYIIVSIYQLKYTFIEWN